VLLESSLLTDNDCFVNDNFLTDATNTSSLIAIEHCIFVLCLDDATPVSLNRGDSIPPTNEMIDRHHWRDDASLGGQTIHGHGSSLNSANRWFDKTMQVNRTNQFLSNFAHNSISKQL
jgi:Choline/Carnitine o-acyltransferase